jgi:hypothetical protein
MNKKYFLIIVIMVVALGAFGYFYFTTPVSPVTPGALDGFAQCLADKGVVMYGSYWCVHCQRQKQLFGDSFRFVTYVECADNPKQCTDAGVQSFPTWKFKDGKTLVGEQTLDALGAESGCSVPASK